MTKKEKVDSEKDSYYELNYSLRESRESHKSIKKEMDSWPDWKIQAYGSNESRTIKDFRSCHGSA